MSSRELDELASDLDDATIVVEELQNDPRDNTDEKLEELHQTLEDASDTIDKLTDNEN